jgi:hypothetical protein
MDELRTVVHVSRRPCPGGGRLQPIVDFDETSIVCVDAGGEGLKAAAAFRAQTSPRARRAGEAWRRTIRPIQARRQAAKRRSGEAATSRFMDSSSFLLRVAGSRRTAMASHRADGRETRGGGHRSTRATGRQLEFAAQTSDVLAKDRRAATAALRRQLAMKLRLRRTVLFETFSQELRMPVESARPACSIVPRRQRLGMHVAVDGEVMKTQFSSDASMRPPSSMKHADAVESRRRSMRDAPRRGSKGRTGDGALPIGAVLSSTNDARTTPALR